jgi:hypothetical protein
VFFFIRRKKLAQTVRFGRGYADKNAALTGAVRLCHSIFGVVFLSLICMASICLMATRVKLSPLFPKRKMRDIRFQNRSGDGLFVVIGRHVADDGFSDRETRVNAGKTLQIGTFLLACGAAVQAIAADLPARKPGLWEVKTVTSSGQSVQLQQCIDAASDQAMQTGFGQTGQRDCAKRDVQKSGNTTTMDSVCTVNGKTMTAHAEITGSFDSEYTMKVTSQGEALPAPRTATINARWLGPCAADQKPGDLIMANGTKINLLNQRKGTMAPAAPGAPPAQ